MLQPVKQLTGAAFRPPLLSLPSARESHLGPGLLPPTCHAAPPNSPLRCLSLQCQSERPETQIGPYFKPLPCPRPQCDLAQPTPMASSLMVFPQLGTECPAQADTLPPLCLVVGPSCGCRALSGIPGLHLLDARSTSTPSTTTEDGSACYQIASLPLRTTALQACTEGQEHLPSSLTDLDPSSAL